MAPVFEVDPFWPKPLPNHWVLGSAVGVGVDSRDHVYIIHREAPLNERTEIGAATDPPSGECCMPAPYVLEFDPEGNLVNAWGGEGRGVHVARVQPRDHHRSDGQRVDRRERRRRRPHPEVHPDGSFLAQYGIPGEDLGSQQHGALRPGRQDLLRRGGPAKPTSPTATATGGSRCWTRTRGRSSASGAPTATCRATRIRAPTTRTRRLTQQFRDAGPLRGADGRRAGLRLRPPEQPDPGLPEGRHVRGRGAASRRGRSATARRGTSRSPVTPSRPTCTWPTART